MRVTRRLRRQVAIFGFGMEGTSIGFNMPRWILYDDFSSDVGQGEVLGSHAAPYPGIGTGTRYNVSGP